MALFGKPKTEPVSIEGEQERLRAIRIAAEQELGRAEFTVVLKTHRVTVRSGVVNHKQLAAFDFGQLAVDGEFVVVLT